MPIAYPTLMTAPPPLFDRVALARNRARATDEGLFLHRAARDTAEDRLDMINKSFTDIAVLTPFSQVWADLWPDAHFVMDDEVLALEPGAHDLVVHAMCLHWANDPVGQLIQCRRALRPDGLCLAVLLGGTTLSELRSVLAEAESRLTGGLSPRVAPMADIRDLGGLLQRAGFALPVADSEVVPVEYRDLGHLMGDLRAMAETNAMSDRLRRPTRRAVFDHAADLYARTYRGSDSRITASFELITLTGWAPSDTQPRPLRPGSAAQRLSDALGADEIRLPD